LKSSAVAKLITGLADKGFQLMEIIIRIVSSQWLWKL